MESAQAFAPATVANVSCGFDILGFGGSLWIRIRDIKACFWRLHIQASFVE